MAKDNEKAPDGADNVKTPIEVPEKPEKEAKKPSGKTIEVEESKLEALFERIDRLEAVASKAGLARFDNANREDLGKKVSVRHYEGKAIVANQLIEDIVEKNPTTGVWVEKQTIRLFFSDNTHEDVPYQTYVRRYTMEPATFQSQTVTKEGITIYKVTLDKNGQEFEMDVRFLN